jgi:Sortase domain
MKFWLHSEKGSREKVWWIASGILLVIVAVCVPLGLQVHHHPLAPPVAAQASFKAAAPVAPTNLTPHAAYSIPVSLQVPAIGLSVSLSRLGLNADGTVQVPTNIQQPGWFDLGPTPGQIGSAVILGHVDSFRGPGVFFNLRKLLVGDQVFVTLADGAVATFGVTSVQQYVKTQFPAAKVYGSDGAGALQLVTCGGQFDQATGHYLSNIVVYTSLKSTTSATATTTPKSTSSADGHG